MDSAAVEFGSQREGEVMRGWAVGAIMVARQGADQVR